MLTADEAKLEVMIRDDERQACWEDFIHVIRKAIEDVPLERSAELRALHEAVFLQGWSLLGTGDGKPMHKREGSAVEEWRSRQ
jgi:hypothetical protein